VSRSEEFDVLGADCDSAIGSGKPRVVDDEPGGFGSASVKVLSSGHESRITLRLYQNLPPRVPAPEAPLFCSLMVIRRFIAESIGVKPCWS
jgi:hypothetical protein